MSVLLKLICIQYNPNHNTSQLFVEIDKQIIKHIWKCEGTGRAKAILEKRTVLEDLYYFFISVLTLRLQLSHYMVSRCMDGSSRQNWESRHRPICIWWGSFLTAFKAIQMRMRRWKDHIFNRWWHRTVSVYIPRIWEPLDWRNVVGYWAAMIFLQPYSALQVQEWSR